MPRTVRPAGGFLRGREMPRLLTMIVMLGVLVMLIERASDPQSWHWLASDDAPRRDLDVASASENIVAPDPAASGPTDEDSLERDAAREEFQAVTDKSPLGKEEMPAYWRLMAWQQHQTTQQMLDRAPPTSRFSNCGITATSGAGSLCAFPSICGAPCR